MALRRLLRLGYTLRVGGASAAERVLVSPRPLRQRGSMAKWKSATGAFDNTVQANQLWSTRGSNSAQVNAANNNKAAGKGTVGKATQSSGAPFNNLNALIVALDAEYDQLPP